MGKKNKNKKQHVSMKELSKLERVIDSIKATYKVEDTLQSASNLAKSGNHEAAKEAAFQIIENGKAPAAKGFVVKSANRKRDKTENKVNLDEIKALVAKAQDASGLAALNTALSKLLTGRDHAQSGLRKTEPGIKGRDLSSLNPAFVNAEENVSVSREAAQDIYKNLLDKLQQEVDAKRQSINDINEKVSKTVADTGIALKAAIALKGQIEAASGAQKELLIAEFQKVVSGVKSKEQLAEYTAERNQKIERRQAEIAEIYVKISDLVAQYDLYKTYKDKWGKPESLYMYASRNVKLHEEAINIIQEAINTLNASLLEQRKTMSVEDIVRKAQHDAKCGKKAAEPSQLDDLYSMLFGNAVEPDVELTAEEPVAEQPVAEIATVATVEEVLAFQQTLENRVAALENSVEESEEVEEGEEDDEVEVELVVIATAQLIDEILLAAASILEATENDGLALEASAEDAQSLIKVAALNVFTTPIDGVYYLKESHQGRDSGDDTKFIFTLTQQDVSQVATELARLLLVGQSA